MSDSITHFWKAIRSLNFDRIQNELHNILQNGLPIENFNGGQSPLHIICKPYYWTKNVPQPLQKEEKNIIKIAKLLIDSLPSLVNDRNCKGETCLMAAAGTGFIQVCQFLIDKGADLHAECDTEGNTVLHHAAFMEQIKTVQFLIKKGAEPEKINGNGDDILQWACLNLETDFLSQLADINLYSEERIIQAYELIGSAFMLSCSNSGCDESFISKGIYYWSKAIENQRYPFMENDNSRLAYKNICEIQTLEELESMKSDKMALRLHAVLKYYRIIGPGHNKLKSLFLNDNLKNYNRILGPEYIKLKSLFVNANFIDPASPLWFTTRYGDFDRYLLMFEMSIENYGFQDETVTRMEDLIQHCLKLINIWFGNFNLECDVLSEHVLGIINVIVGKLESVIISDKSKSLTEEEKTFRKFTLEVFLCNFPYFLYMYELIPTLEYEDKMLRNLVFRINRIVAVIGIPHVLLHKISRDEDLYVNRRGSHYCPELPRIFPSPTIANLLLECGADVNAVNTQKQSALHIVASHREYYPDVIEVLINHRGHIDQRDVYGVSVYELLQRHHHPINFLNHITLQCLAARVINVECIDYKMHVPTVLYKFIEMHSCALQYFY